MPEERIPIIHLRDLLLVSVQVELSDRVVLQLKEDITREVARSRVRGLIVDLTGVDFMDSYISRTLRDISIMTSLMGVPTVLCGMHAVIAMTMTEMGIELGGLSMSLNLDAALRSVPKYRPGSRRRRARTGQERRPRRDRSGGPWRPRSRLLTGAAPGRSAFCRRSSLT